VEEKEEKKIEGRRAEHEDELSKVWYRLSKVG
jgi:hypothetical protein